MHCLVLFNFGKAGGIDSLRWLLLLNDSKNTVVKMLIEVLGIAESP